MGERKHLPIVGAPKGERRRLPVLQPVDPAEEEEAERPPWHWAVIGAVAALLLVVPLLMLFQALARFETSRLLPYGAVEEAALAYQALSTAEQVWLGAVNVGAQLVPVALAALAGGALVGRFGGQARVREAALSGVGAGLFMSLISATPLLGEGRLAAWAVASVAMVLVAGAAARAGGALGFRRRRG